MKVKELCSYLDTSIPLSFQEPYDNSGLQIGNPEGEIHSAILSFDVTEDVLDEAIAKGCGLIISHHPLIFEKIKRLNYRSSVDKIIVKSIKNDIAIYSAHTNLDNINGGVSFKMASLMGLKDIKVLSPMAGKLLKLVTYVPEGYAEKVKQAMFDVGAGEIGRYDSCSFASKGEGSFRAGKDTNPFVGQQGELHIEKEVRIETVVPTHLKDKVVGALLIAHPYEEVAYDIYKLENIFNEAGLGCVGEFEDSIDEKSFIGLLKNTFNKEGIRSSVFTGEKIKKVSVCGGAGISLLENAITSGSQAFVTGDIKYHNFFEVDKRLLLVDVGHFESENFSTEILYNLIIKKFPKFAVRFSEINTNPINYF